MAFHRWLYQNGRPNPLAKLLNWGWGKIFALGKLPENFVTLNVVGRKSGKPISFPLAMAVLNGERYLVSMLGEQANWVQNVHAADGIATLRHGYDERVRLIEIDAAQRAPILKAYLQIAPGARPHIPIDQDAPIAEFEKIAAEFPVFRLESIK